MSLEKYVGEVEELLKKLRASYGGKYVLFRGRDVVGAFSSRGEALKRAVELDPGIYVLAYVPAEGEEEF